MIRVTIESNNRFYTFISTGFIMMILFHIFENIGATVGILPLTGIPLPFISQGEVPIISGLIEIGLILSMSYQNSLNQERNRSAFRAVVGNIIELVKTLPRQGFNFANTQKSK